MDLLQLMIIVPVLVKKCNFDPDNDDGSCDCNCHKLGMDYLLSPYSTTILEPAIKKLDIPINSIPISKLEDPKVKKAIEEANKHKKNNEDKPTVIPSDTPDVTPN